MNFRITVIGSHPFSLAYGDDELKDFIWEYIKSRKEKGHPYFTYFTLIQIILDKANNEDKLEGRDKNTYYESPDLDQEEYTRVSRLLWDFIYDKKIYIDFSNNKYIAHYNNDTVFGIF